MTKRSVTCTVETGTGTTKVEENKGTSICN